MSQKCVARKVIDGKPCKRWASQGATVCSSHGSLAPQVARAALVRAEVERWKLGDVVDDPGLVLLKLLSQSRQRADLYAGLLAEQYASPDPITNIPAGVKALIGYRYAIDSQGGRHQVEEIVRGLVLLESQERDRLAKFSALAITAGLAERQTRIDERISEQDARLVYDITTRNLAALHLTPHQLEAFRTGVAADLRAISAGDSR